VEGRLVLAWVGPLKVHDCVRVLLGRAAWGKVAHVLVVLRIVQLSPWHGVQVRYVEQRVARGRPGRSVFFQVVLTTSVVKADEIFEDRL
jgi:hypothetical protein